MSMSLSHTFRMNNALDINITDRKIVRITTNFTKLLSIINFIM